MAIRTTTESHAAGHDRPAEMDLTAKIEPFDSFWEGPTNIEKGYTTVYEFYRHNYLSHLPGDRDAAILVISCGPGYFVDMLVRQGYRNVAVETLSTLVSGWICNCRIQPLPPLAAPW